MNKESHQKLQNAVRDLLPVLTARGSDIEAARRVPPDLLEQLKSAGVFRMFLPESHGGCGLRLAGDVEDEQHGPAESRGNVGARSRAAGRARHAVEQAH